MRNFCRADTCDDYPRYIRRGTRLEFPLLLVRRREDGTRGYSGMASQKPVELMNAPDDVWDELRHKVNTTIYTCPFSYGRAFCHILLWFGIATVAVIMGFGAIGPEDYFWEAFWKCQSKHHLYHEPYTQEFCAQYSGWGSACMLSFFTLFSGGLLVLASREAWKIKQWKKQVEPTLSEICMEYSPHFEKYGYFIEVVRWKIVFRHVASDGFKYSHANSVVIDEIPATVEVPIEQSPSKIDVA